MAKTPKHDLPSRAYFAEMLQRHQNRTERTYRDIANDMGLESENHLSNLKSGASKISIDQIPALCRAIPELDAIELTLKRLAEEHPTTWGDLESQMATLLPSEAERSILAAVGDVCDRHRLSTLAPIETAEERAIVEQMTLQLAALQADYDSHATVDLSRPAVASV